MLVLVNLFGSKRWWNRLQGSPESQALPDTISCICSRETSARPLSLSPYSCCFFFPRSLITYLSHRPLHFLPSLSLSVYNCQCRCATEHLSTQEGQQLRGSQEQIKTKQDSNTGERGRQTHFCRGSCTVTKNGGYNSEQMGLLFCLQEKLVKWTKIKINNLLSL